MLKKIVLVLGLAVLSVLLTGALTAAASPPPVAPNTTFTLVSGLPTTMNVGDQYTVVVQVESDAPFLFAQALPSSQFPGRGVVGAAGDHAGAGTSAMLEVTFTAKESTADYANSPGYSQVSVVVGVRYQGGYVATERYDFVVTVP